MNARKRIMIDPRTALPGWLRDSLEFRSVGLPLSINASPRVFPPLVNSPWKKLNKITRRLPPHA
jgi:hypothetical protein